MQGGKPWGKGTFHGYVMRDGQEQDKVSYTGKWKDGRLAGKGVLRTLAGEFLMMENFLIMLKWRDSGKTGRQ